MQQEKNIFFLSSDMLVTGVIVGAWAFFLLLQTIVGFWFLLWLGVAVATFFLSARSPKAGLFSLIALTILFERFFTLTPLALGDGIIRFYPIDVVMLGVMTGIGWKPLTRESSGGSISRGQSVGFFIFVFLTIIYFFIGVRDENIDTAFSVFKNYIFYGSLSILTAMVIRSKQDIWELLFVFFGITIGIFIFLGIGIVRGEGLWTEFTPLSTEGIRFLAFPHGFYAGLAILVSLGLLSVLRNGWQRKLLLWSAPLWGIAMMLSMMRHLWIAFFVAIFIFFVMELCSGKRVWQREYIAYGLICIFLTATVIYIALLSPIGGVSTHMQDIFSSITLRASSVSNLNDESTNWRMVVWRESFTILRETYFMGTGLGKRVGVEIGAYREFIEIRNIHNSLFALLVQMGVIGFASFIGYISIAIVGVWRELLKNTIHGLGSRILLALLVFQMVASLFQPYLETNLLGIFFWITIGLLFSWAHIKESSYENIGNQ